MAARSVPRDIYVQDVDFTALALQYPDFAKRLKSNKQLDFSDPESVRQLTKALLLRDFNLSLKLPENRLCPPVPNRFNYVLWIQDLLDSTSEDFRERHDPSRKVVGLDIGTGASAIYPLLACRQHAKWRMLATETDAVSLEYARRNIAVNGLQERIRIAPVTSGGPLLPAAISSLESIDFVMTNPPFYASEDEMLESARKKLRPPNSACTGAPMEMITDGGEVVFVSKLIEESLDAETRERIQWFTSMLGKLTSVSTIVEKLRQKACTNYAVHELVQGQRTRRWVVAWSWQDFRPCTAIARGVPGFEKRLLPVPADFVFSLAGENLDTIVKIAICEVRSLDLLFRWNSTLSMGVGMAREDVWSRKARRKKMKDEDADHEMDKHNLVQSPALVFKILMSEDTGPQGAEAVKVHVRWLQGQDAMLFESFCGWLQRKMRTRDD